MKKKKRCPHFAVLQCRWLAGRQGRKLLWGQARVCCHCGEFLSIGDSNDQHIDFEEVDVANAVLR